MKRRKFKVTASEPVRIEVTDGNGKRWEILITTSVADVKEKEEPRDGKPDFDLSIQWRAEWEPAD